MIRQTFSGRFHAWSDVHGVTKKTVSWHRVSHHSCSFRTRSRNHNHNRYAYVVGDVFVYAPKYDGNSKTTPPSRKHNINSSLSTYLRHMVLCVFRCVIWESHQDDDELWSVTLDPEDQEPYCRSFNGMNVKAKLNQTSLSRTRQSGIECHTADLDNVSACVRFWQSTYNHVCVSNCLHLKTSASSSVSEYCSQFDGLVPFW